MGTIGIDGGDAIRALAGSALRGGIVLALVALAACGARRRSASLRHGLWAAAVLACLILPLAAMTLPRWTVALLPPLPTSVAGEPVGSDGGWKAAAILDPAPALAPAGLIPGRPVAPAVDLPWLLLSLWLIGAVLMLGRRAGAEAKLRRWRISARVISDPPRLRAMSAAVTALGIRRPVRLLESERVGVPLVCGGWNPCIILPPTSASWDAAALRGVLLHELAHVRRGDLRWNLLAHLVRALFWFDPLLWLAAHRLRVEGEQAADDVVLAAGERPSGYAGMLLALATTAPRAPAAGMAFLGRSGLGARIDAILSRRDRRPPALPEVVAGALILAATAGLLAVVEPGRGAATAARAPERRAARFENPPGSPLRILQAEVFFIPGVGRAGAEVRLTRPHLKLENPAGGRRVSGLELRLATPGVSDDRMWEDVSLAPGEVLDLRLPEGKWSNQAPAALAARLVVGISAVRFADGSSWGGRGADSPVPPDGTAGGPMLAPSPERSVTPAPSPALGAPPGQTAPHRGSGDRRTPSPLARADRVAPPPEPVSYLAARFQNPAGAPLVIEDARTPVFAASGERPSTTALPVITFQNATARRITSVRLRFKAGTDAHAVTVVRTPIEPHGTLVFRRDSFELDGDPAHMAVQILGVGFADGTSWGTLSSTIDTRDEWIYPLEEPGRP